MKLYAICLVKNEDDLIAQTLSHAGRFCDAIFVIDNGSTDKTWEIVQSSNLSCDKIVPFRQTFEPYDEGLRWHVYDAHHRHLTENDWWLILDGDELLAEDPRPVIEEARRERADVINAWQIQFYYTDKDYKEWMAKRDDRDKPIGERRRYYRIDWQEPRLFRNQTRPDVIFRQSKLLTNDSPWGKSVLRMKGNVARRRIFNRHFQYRDPPQITKRLQQRYGRPEFAAQVKSLDWHSVMRPAKYLTYYRDDDPWCFSATGLAHCYSGWLKYIWSSRYGRLRARVGALARI